jgi:hypothetical protein
MKSISLYAKIIVVTLLLIGGIDQAIRAYDTWTGALLRDLLAEVGPTGGMRKIYHPYLQYTSPPSFEGRVPHIEPGRLFHVRTNGHGFRSEEFFPPLLGQKRVLLLGDSFVYGYNANQNSTLASVIKEMATTDGLANVDVLSLGVPSYSGLRYAMLARLYFDYLKPDVVIVAIDQSDFLEDVSRKNEYVLDADSCPTILKNADFSRRERLEERVVFDATGAMVKAPEFDRRLRLRFISGFYNRIARIAPSSGGVMSDATYAKQQQAFLANSPVRYEELVAARGDDISAVLPKQLLHDSIPYSFERARQEYAATREALACVKRLADRVGARMFTSSYPYPWYVSTSESVGYLQNMGAKAPIDFTRNRINPRLARLYSDEIGVAHLDAYPLYEGKADGMFGRFDPHFTEAGYRRYAEFLYRSIRDELKRPAPTR